MAHRIKFSLDTGKSHPEFAHDALAVYEGLRENAASPNPPIAVEDVKSTIDAYFMASYREKNQDPLLKLAGEYFLTLTCGAFDALVIDDVGNQRALRGVRSS